MITCSLHDWKGQIPSQVTYFKTDASLCRSSSTSAGSRWSWPPPCKTAGVQASSRHMDYWFQMMTTWWPHHSWSINNYRVHTNEEAVPIWEGLLHEDSASCYKTLLQACKSGQRTLHHLVRPEADMTTAVPSQQALQISYSIKERVGSTLQKPADERCYMLHGRMISLLPYLPYEALPYQFCNNTGTQSQCVEAMPLLKAVLQAHFKRTHLGTWWHQVCLPLMAKWASQCLHNLFMHPRTQDSSTKDQKFCKRELKQMIRRIRHNADPTILMHQLLMFSRT